jgi:hypothetical protein
MTNIKIVEKVKCPKYGGIESPVTYCGGCNFYQGNDGETVACSFDPTTN